MNTEQYTVAAVNGASIIIVLSGRAKANSCSLDGESLELKRGSVIFISAQESLQLVIESHDSGMVMYRAYCTSEIWSVLLASKIRFVNKWDHLICIWFVHLIGSFCNFVLYYFPCTTESILFHFGTSKPLSVAVQQWTTLKIVFYSIEFVSSHWHSVVHDIWVILFLL